METVDWLTKNLYEELSNKLDSLIIKGLKNKGFEFENKIELENFIKTRCKAEDYVLEKRKVFLVDKIPFLVHYYETVNNLDYSEKELKVNFGNYSFL